MMETQKTIGDWADEAFGKVTSFVGTGIRANTEMAELLDALQNNKSPAEIAIECADVVIVLKRLCEAMGVDLDEAIITKMAINRSRTWVLDGHGHGQHIESVEA
jgi:NTP pyrophosphatase (non-canonical NTP hydrolase)